VVDDALRLVEEDLSLNAIDRPIPLFALDPLAIDLFAKDVEADILETVAGIDTCGAAMGGAISKCISVREI
jgi:hypothetical protein